MNRFWLHSYPEGVPQDIDTTQYTSILDVMLQSVDKYPNKVAFSNFGTKVTFTQLNTLSKNFAHYLQRHTELSKGDRIGIMLPNILQYPIAIFGILRAGYTIVNIDPMYTARELKHQLDDSGAKALIVLANFAHVAESVLPETQVKHVITTQVGDRLDFPKSHIINFILKHIKKMVPRYNIPDTVSFNDALKHGQQGSHTDVELTHKDIAFLQYTGGTTGLSKGAILTHGNMVANMLQASAWAGQDLKSGSERMITALPLYHIFSLTANCLFMMCKGCENILITNPRDFLGFIKILQKEDFSIITGVNTLYRKMLDTRGFDKIDFSSLKVTFAGGMAVTHDVAKEWKSRTGSTVIEAYGLTETSPAACINPLTLDEYNGYIGLPISSTYIQIKDETGKDVGIDQEGELCIKGPQVTQGYWNLPELNDTTFTQDGFFRTGDYAKINDAGYVQILDRKKDMILVSGFNVYPNEIDDIVSKHEKVTEAAAIGIDDSVTGQAVKLFVVKADESLNEKELQEYCHEHLTGYKCPKVIEFIDELPKSNVGKILRKDLH